MLLSFVTLSHFEEPYSDTDEVCSTAHIKPAWIQETSNYEMHGVRSTQAIVQL